MRRAKVLWGLAVLNAVLLTALMWKLGGGVGGNAAHAQNIGRGDLIMVPADVTGANAGVVYMINTRDGILTAFSYDTNNRTITAMNPLDLRRLFGGGQGLGSGATGGGAGGTRQPVRRN